VGVTVSSVRVTAATVARLITDTNASAIPDSPERESSITGKAVPSEMGHPGRRTGHRLGRILQQLSHGSDSDHRD